MAGQNDDLTHFPGMNKTILFSGLTLLSTCLPSLFAQRNPASTPALPVADAVKSFTLPTGFEIRNFCAEPDVVNPVAMTWDQHGRLWVVELYEYPKGAAKDARPRDRIKILEDTDGDERADKITIFADGLNLATGIALGHGGVYVGQAPHLLFLRDTDNDDQADEREILLTGFGLHDTHELLNGFAWGPDGWLYMTHGVFTHSKVRRPDQPESEAVTLDAGVGRYHPGQKRFEVFSDGTSNPWGVDFDARGHAFLSACVIDHLFHMLPGGLYARQGGSPPHRFGYERLSSIVDHKHQRAAYCGVQVYQGDQYPETWRGHVFMGNIHGNCINRDRLVPRGCSFTAHAEQDFLRSSDGWFRPVSIQTGPDGALWIADWYDKFPCYQNAKADPEGVDRTYGRIWRVVYVGTEAGKPVSPHPETAWRSKINWQAQLKHPNSWMRRMARRQITDSGRSTNLLSGYVQDVNLDEAIRLEALWTLHGLGETDGNLLDRCATDPAPGLRLWSARLTGEIGTFDAADLDRLTRLASDVESTVRSAVVTACRQAVSRGLTVNLKVKQKVDTLPVLAEVVRREADTGDERIRFLTWMALEPLLLRSPDKTLAWIESLTRDCESFCRPLLYKSARRLCDSSDAAAMQKVTESIARLVKKHPAMAEAGLNGLIEGQKGKIRKPSESTGEFFKALYRSPVTGVKSKTEQLGALWGDEAALLKLLKQVHDTQRSNGDRIEQIEALAEKLSPKISAGLLDLVKSELPGNVLDAAVRALAGSDHVDVPNVLLGRWAEARIPVAETLLGRPTWTRELLAAVRDRRIGSAEVPVPILRRLSQHADESIREDTAKWIGTFRKTDADTEALIARKRLVVTKGEVDLEAGRQLAEQNCLVCHRFHGKGKAVGPDLTGSGRASLDNLLVNILDPDQVIGRGYENTIVTTTDGQSMAGRMVEDSPQRIRLLGLGGVEMAASRDKVKNVEVMDQSLMPRGFENLPDADFRNLVWFLIAPPEEGGLSDKKRKELSRTADGKDNHDNESVALWNPDWHVYCPEFEGAPNVLSTYAGRNNVLRTHPIDRNTPSVLERVVKIPANAKSARLRCLVSAREGGRSDWELRVLVNEKELQRQTIRQGKKKWTMIETRLDAYKGQEILIRLENRANGWSWEFGFWGKIELEIR